MVRKLKKHTLKILFALMLVPLLAIAVFYAWVVAKPRSLDEYIPQIEAAIEEKIDGYDIKISKADLNWGGMGDFLNIRLSNVDISDSQQAKIANIPTVEMDLKVLPLLIGEFVPANFSVSNITALLKNQVVKIVQFDADFVRDSVRFLGKLEYDEKPIFIRGNSTLSNGVNKATIYADKINLQNFAKFSPYLAASDITLDLKSELIFDAHKLSKINVKAANISGKYEELEIASGAFAAELALDSPNFKVSDFSLSFADGVKLSATASGKAENDFDAQVKIHALDIKNLPKYWPKEVSANAREWVKTSMVNGSISDAEAKISIRPWHAAAAEIPADAVQAKFNFKDVDVNYVEGLAPVTKGSGRAEMSATTLEFFVDAAEIDGSKITNTKVKIDGIGVLPIETLEMSGDIEGSPATLIAFYERAHPKDAIIRAKNIEGGTAKTRAELRFPLDKNLLLVDIGIVLDAEIVGATAKGLDSGAELTNFNAKIAMDDKGYQLIGSVNARPNIAKENLTTGIIPLTFDVSDKDNIEQYNLKADMTDAELNIKDLGIKKAIGDKARVEITARKKADFADIQNFKFTSDALKFEGDGVLRKDLSDFTSLNFYTLSFGKSVLSGKVTRDAGYKIYMKGNYFDAAPFVKDSDEEKKPKDRSKPPIYIELKLNELGLANGESIKNAALTIACARDDCDEVNLTADKVKLNLNKQKLLITSTDAGSVLRGFDAYEDMKGGELLLQADVSKVGENNRYIGNLKIQDYKIENSEFLVGLLRLGSLTGILDILQGQGISFDKLNADFDYESDVLLQIKSARMKGNSIGGTAEGTINLANDALDVQGKIIPAYSANTILGEVPVLGDLLIGDDGVFALAYTIKGTADKPEQMVNPLSVLAPGFLQKVFE